MRHAGLLLSLLLPLSPRAAEDPAHAELRTFREKAIAAITAGDLDGLMPLLHADVVVTWQNAEVCRGHDGVKAFLARTGKEAFQGWKVPPEPDELTLLHGGDTGVSFGRNVSQVKLPGGKTLDFENRWTATLVREQGAWKLAAYHVSINALANPLLDAARNLLGLTLAGGAVGGLILGAWLGRRARTRTG